MKRICVYCGSNTGNDQVYEQAAEALGATLAARGIGLVYGGGAIGLMGRIAETVMASGGMVQGVIPRSMTGREIARTDLTKLHVVETMHERKARMAALADGFIALPGGLGTLDEIFEIWTWAQLGAHDKPVGFLNVGGFFDPLFHYLDHAVEAGFLQPRFRAMALVAETPGALLDRFSIYRPPERTRWLDRADV